MNQKQTQKLDLGEDLPTDRFYVEIDMPDDVELLEIPIEELPEHWDSKPRILETQYIGEDFVAQKIAAVLKVTSNIIPPEYHNLINLQHSDVNKIRQFRHNDCNLTVDLNPK